MALPTTYTQSHNQLAEFFGKIRDAQAPDKFTLQIIKDFGFKSINHRAFLPILKALGFLTADGAPTQRYHDYRNHSASKAIMGQAIKEAYSDIFLIKEKPTASDKGLIEGKFKSYHNTSDNIAGIMSKTFYSLLDLADLSADSKTKTSTQTEINSEKVIEEVPNKISSVKHSAVGLHYNIQIHLLQQKMLKFIMQYLNH